MVLDNADINIKPYMRPLEVEIITSIIQNLKPMKVLEWGSGYSTLYFSKLIPEDAVWISIEHNVKWADKVGSFINNRKVKLICVKPNNIPWGGPGRDGTYQDFKDYVDEGRKFAPYDFILVDGRARADCLTFAYDILNEKGVIVLHDAQRDHYHNSLKKYEKQMFFLKKKGVCKLWVGSKSANLAELFDTEKYRNACDGFFKKMASRIFKNSSSGVSYFT